MIQILNQSITVSQLNNALGVALSFEVTDTVLSSVSAIVEWGDGTTTTVSRQAKPVAVSLQHVYGPGTFIIQVVAQNYAVPAPQTARWTSDAVYYQTPTGAPPPGPTASQYTYVGPIMPRTNGSPNPQNWGWNEATDTILLEGSLYLLLMTNKGEYLMDSQYGANLRPLVFSPNDGVLTDVIKNDVSTSVQIYEPRAQLQNLRIVQQGNTATVSTSFSTTLGNGVIPLTLQISQ